MEIFAGQAEFVPGVVQQIAAYGADLLISVLSGLQVGEGHLAVTIGGAIRDLVAVGVEEPVHHTGQRLSGFGVYLQDLDAALGQCVGTLLGDVQRRCGDGGRVSGAVHHIALRRADLLIGIAAQRQVAEYRPAVRAGGHVGHFIAAGVKQPVGDA